MPATAENYLPPLPPDFDGKLRTALRHPEIMGPASCADIYQESGLHRDTVSYIRKVYGALGKLPGREAIDRFERGRLKRCQAPRRNLRERRKAEREARGVSLAQEREVREALSGLRAIQAEQSAALTKAASERARWDWRRSLQAMTFRRNWQVPESARFSA